MFELVEIADFEAKNAFDEAFKGAFMLLGISPLYVHPLLCLS